MVKIFNSSFSAEPDGNVSVKIVFDGILEREEKTLLLAQGLLEAQRYLREKGWLDKAGDFPAIFEYWHKIISENKLPYGEDSQFGSFQASVWLPGYLGNEQEVADYIRKVNEALAQIAFAQKNEERITCPRCGKVPFEYVVSSFTISGICKNGCGFRLNNFQDLFPGKRKFANRVVSKK